MKILIVNRFFGGAQIPTGRMAEDVARLLVEAGHEVVALASTGTYAGAEKRAQHGARSMERGAAAQARDQESKRLKDQKTSEQRPEFGDRRSEMGSAQSGELRVEEVRVPKWMPRALAWVWFTWQARQRIPRMDWDVCVLMTDPPLLPLLAARVKAAGGSVGQCFGRAVEDERLKHRRTETPPHRATRRVAVWLMDLYPEALAASGRLGPSNPLYKWYFSRRQQSLAAADLLICLGETQKERLETKRPKDEKPSENMQITACVRTAVVPPWDDRGNIALATEESLRNLALYAGNLGEAHCFEEILAAAPYLPADWTIRFAVRGAKLSGLKEKAGQSGHGLTRMKGRISPPGSADRTVENAHAGGPPALAVSPPSEEAKTPGAKIEITGYASEEETPELLASARVHLITMSPGWEGIVVPSKLYGCIRTGRPALFIGPENADTAREIRAHDWGKVLPAGASGEEVAAAILELAARPTRATQSENGAKKVAELIQGLATAEQSEP